ncbi:MAG: GTP cyclohydrolase I FolE [Bdellovibrionales bacterium]|nr:GTP cyclohydrolase I FolE [Bdellovibrionales bacterium]
MNQQNVDLKKILEKMTPTPTLPVSISPEEQIEKIEHHFKAIMETLGLDLRDDSLQKTPHRVAKMYVNEIFSGLREENFPKVTVIDNKMKYDQMIVAKHVGIMTVCEHHFVTIDGLATIAYIPNKKVIGLSKLNRIAKYFSRRPQVQERLTKQIADCLQTVLETDHVAVNIDAKHYCLASRGIEDTNSTTNTCDVRGDFRGKPETRGEFLRHCQIGILKS